MLAKGLYMVRIIIVIELSGVHLVWNHMCDFKMQQAGKIGLFRYRFELPPEKNCVQMPRLSFL